jgi:hypothetical protein
VRNLKHPQRVLRQHTAHLTHRPSVPATCCRSLMPAAAGGVGVLG